MSKLTKLERLEKAVVDTEAAYGVAYAASDAAYDVAYAAYAAAWDDAWDAAYDAWVKAKLDLSNYLKEQQDNG